MASYLAMLTIGRFTVRKGRTPGGIREIVATDGSSGADVNTLFRQTAQATDWVYTSGYPPLK